MRVTGPSDVTFKTEGQCQSGRDTIRNRRSSKSTIVHRLKVEDLPRSWTSGIFLFTSARDSISAKEYKTEKGGSPVIDSL